MEEILKLYNIKTVQFFDSKNVRHRYSFNDQMLANNIFIENYSIDADDEEFQEDEDSEYGSQLSVIMEQQKKYYQFLMYHETFEIGVPVILLQTIIFLTNLIEKINPDQLPEYLNNIAIAPLIPHEIPDKEFREVANKMIKLKIKTVHDLINKRKADLN